MDALIALASVALAAFLMWMFVELGLVPMLAGADPVALF